MSEQAVHFVDHQRKPDDFINEPGLEPVTIVREGSVDHADRSGGWYWKVGKTKEGKYVLFMPGLVRDGRVKMLPINVANSDERLKRYIVEMANSKMEVW